MTPSRYPLTRRAGYWVWFGQLVPVVYVLEFDCQLAREYANPSTHKDALDRIAQSVADAYVSDVQDKELNRESLRSKIEESIANRHGRPAMRLEIWVEKLPTRKLRPLVESPAMVEIPSAPPTERELA